MNMIEPALEWATAPGPPNWVFVVTLLTAPHLWSRYVKQAAQDVYAERFGN